MTMVSPALTALVGAMILVVGLVSCGKSPVAPSQGPALSGPSPSSPAIQAFRVTGHVVDSADRAVAGARIALLTNGRSTPLQAVADASGAYTLAIDARYVDPGDGFVLSVEKDGFEPSWLFMARTPGVTELTRNVRLREILRIGAGESVELSIDADDSVCDDMDGWTCRRVRVVCPVAGQLTAEVPDGSSGPHFLIRWPGPPSYDYRSSFRMWVAAGSETIVDLILVGGSAHRATLTTRLEPS